MQKPPPTSFQKTHNPQKGCQNSAIKFGRRLNCKLRPKRLKFINSFYTLYQFVKVFGRFFSSSSKRKFIIEARPLQTLLLHQIRGVKRHKFVVDSVPRTTLITLKRLTLLAQPTWGSDINKQVNFLHFLLPFANLQVKKNLRGSGIYKRAPIKSCVQRFSGSNNSRLPIYLFACYEAVETFQRCLIKAKRSNC